MGYKLNLIITLIFAVANSEYASYDKFKVYKIIPTTEKEVQILVDLQKQGDYSFWTDVIKELSDVRIMVSPEKQGAFEEYLKSVGVVAKVCIEDVQKAMDAQLQRPRMNRSEYSWDYYQTLEEIYDWLDKTVESYPDVVTPLNIGRTAEGRDIRGVKIDFKKQSNPTIGMLEGGIHAREWISPATLTWIIKEFLTSSNSEVRALAENIVWHIFPVINADGYAYTFTDNRMWRKNRNSLNNGTCSGWSISDDMSNGVDLNRNFGFLWMTTGASSNPCSEVYAGPVANSELETRAIINHVGRLQQEGNLVFYYAFHSFSQMVLVPFSHVGGADVLEAPNYADMFEIAIRGMDKLKERYGTDYIVGTSADILYETSGGSFDWAKGVAEIPIVYLFELRDDGDYGFLLPPNLIVANNEEIIDGLVEMDRISRHMGYYQRGSGNSVIANIMLLSIVVLNFIIQ